MDEKNSAEKHKNLPRIYLDEAGFAAGETLGLGDAQAHYLRNVMRLSPGECVRVFNGRDGEWIAEATAVAKSGVTLRLSDRILAQDTGADIHLLVSPLKREAFELVIEKATELGVSRIVPVLCARTVVRKVNLERARAIAIEAAEQCERLDVPVIAPPEELRALPGSWDKSRALLFCRERGQARPFLEAVSGLKAGSWAILVGPEGGFSDPEQELLERQGFVTAVSLGRRILRAETATLTALSLLQACVSA